MQMIYLGQVLRLPIEENYNYILEYDGVFFGRRIKRIYVMSDKEYCVNKNGIYQLELKLLSMIAFNLNVRLLRCVKIEGYLI